MRIRCEVTGIDFDPEGGELRLNGVVLGVQHRDPQGAVGLGSHHTLEIEKGRVFTLAKASWDVIAMERLTASEHAGAAAELAAVLVQHGLATVCLISGGMSVVRAKIEAHIPRKGNAAQQTAANKAIDTFQERLLQAVLRHVDLDVIKCIVLAGPGFVKDDFFAFMFEQASRRDMRALAQSRPKWLLCHASSAYKHALKEVLTNDAVLARVAHTTAAAEVKVLATFFQQLSEQPQRVTYGYNHVVAAAEQGAIDKLLLADSLFRAQHVARRRQYVALVEGAREAGAGVHIFSSLHVSGEQLANLSGVAAILRFPLPIDVEEDDDDEEGEPAAQPPP